jgi:hypothetical protein
MVVLENDVRIYNKSKDYDCQSPPMKKGIELKKLFTDFFIFISTSKQSFKNHCF